MLEYRVLDAHDDPPGAIRGFLQKLYTAGGLEALLVPLRVNGRIEPRWVTDPGELTAADPLAPVMQVNAASLVAQEMIQHPQKRIGAVLRACELRALYTLAARHSFDPASILSVGLDCLGTFPLELFEQRGGADPLTREVLRFARQGGVAGYRHRLACQMCLSPLPDAASVAIHLLGLPARSHLLVSAKQPEWNALLPDLTSGPAPAELIVQHERMRLLVKQRHERAMQRILNALSTDMVMSVDDLVDHLAGCEVCEACLTACPLMGAGPQPRPLTRDQVISWLMACAGCGMCEQACPQHLPLAAIFRRIQRELFVMLNDREESGTASSLLLTD